jgi:hypothetical protein
MTYERLGSELDSDLIPLCEECHDEVHRQAAGSILSLTMVTLQYVALKAAKNGAVARAERYDAARGIGDRQPGERRRRACSSAESKTEFTPRNQRGRKPKKAKPNPPSSPAKKKPKPDVADRIKVPEGAEFSLVGRDGRFRFLSAEARAGGTVLRFLSTQSGAEVSVSPSQVQKVHCRKSR